jgi:hypothetical protein
VLSGEATNTNFIVFGLTRSELELTIYRTRGEHARFQPRTYVPIIRQTIENLVFLFEIRSNLLNATFNNIPAMFISALSLFIYLLNKSLFHHLGTIWHDIPHSTKNWNIKCNKTEKSQMHSDKSNFKFYVCCVLFLFLVMC